MPLKKTEINSSLFPDSTTAPRGPGETTDSNKNIIFTATQDVTAPSSYHEGSNMTSRAASLHENNSSHDKIHLVQFDKDDAEDPHNWPNSRKWNTTILLCSMTMIIGLSTTAYSSGIGSMTTELGVSNVIGQVGLFAFNISCAILPLFIAPLCELTGRRFIYLSAFAAFTLVTFGLAFAENIATVIICRLLSGATGSIGTILVGGTLSDIWTEKDISIPLSLFTFSAIFSTIFAPAYSGYIDQYVSTGRYQGWRWIQFIHLAASALVLILEVLTFKETRGEAILRQRAAKLRKNTGQSNLRARSELEGSTLAELFRASSLRAVKLLGTEPVVVFLGVWLALAWGTAFLFLSVISITFIDIRGWSKGNAGLPYLALALGCFFAFAAGLLQDHFYERNKEKNNGKPSPEARLYFACLGGPLFPIGIMIYAWTGPFPWVTYWGCLVGLFLIIIGIYAIFLCVYNYTSDSYPTVASSAIAAQGLMRNTFAAVTPLFATQMFNGMGVQWAGLLLSLVAFLITPLPFILYFKGKTIRSQSKNAASDDELHQSMTGEGEKTA